VDAVDICEPVGIGACMVRGGEGWKWRDRGVDGEEM